MKRALVVLAIASIGALYTFKADAYCPSYTPAQTANGSKCGINPAPGTNPTVAQWQDIFTKVHGGPASWGTEGPEIPMMNTGCGKPTPKTPVPPRFPCTYLKAMTMQESIWTQFCKPESPAGSVGAPSRTIVSFDCGYGISQVTSGMHVGENPKFDRARVAAEPTYNLATGTLILRDKWAATACVGDNIPEKIEHWYTATWAYNGLAYQNNPNNPNLKAGRGPYNPKNGGAYAYQEKVWGWMEHPPTPEHWAKLEPAYPNRGNLGNSGSPGAIPDPTCASPTSCSATRALHTSTCIKDTPVNPIGEDGGTIPIDPIDGGKGSSGGTSGNNAGGGNTGGGEDGCGCHAVGRPSHAGEPRILSGLALALGLALARARRNRRARA